MLKICQKFFLRTIIDLHSWDCIQWQPLLCSHTSHSLSWLHFCRQINTIQKEWCLPQWAMILLSPIYSHRISSFPYSPDYICMDGRLPPLYNTRFVSSVLNEQKNLLGKHGLEGLGGSIGLGLKILGFRLSWVPRVQLGSIGIKGFLKLGMSAKISQYMTLLNQPDFDKLESEIKCSIELIYKISILFLIDF